MNPHITPETIAKFAPEVKTRIALNGAADEIYRILQKRNGELQHVIGMDMLYSRETDAAVFAEIESNSEVMSHYFCQDHNQTDMMIVLGA